jgi:ABC-type multidrug transport system fused ATPase/permease subunit
VLARNVNVVSFSFVAGVLRPLATMACEATLFLLLFGAVLLYSPKAAGLVLLIFLPTVIVYYRLVRRRLNRYGEVENRAHREKARVVMETFRGYSEVEINRAFPLMLKRFDKAMDEIVEVQQKNATLGQLPSLFTETGLALGMALLVIVSLRGETGDIRLLFGVFAVAALRLMPSVRSLMSGWAAIKYNRYTIDILREAQIESEQQNKEDAERMGLQQAIRIEGLTFCFEDSPEKPLIENLSLTIHKGERIGIRGESGRGKTTLFNLLLGFYPPTQGRIWIDDTPLTPENRRRWQNSVGYVSQNVFLTDSTFAANVALGETEDRIDRERVRQALEQAQLLPFIDSLPQGMETPIGECGCRISGGQRQRIGIARALYKGADVLLIDEATSSLDNRTEEGINRSIEALSKGNSDLTIIVIAHRETSLSYCDRIIEM